MKHKIIPVLLTAAFLCSLCGCSKKAEEVANTEQSEDTCIYNVAYDTASMYTVNGLVIPTMDDDVTVFPANGCGFLMPDAWNDLSFMSGLNIYDLNYNLVLGQYAPREYLEPYYNLSEDVEEDEYYEVVDALNANQVNVFAIYRENRLEETDDETKEALKNFSKDLVLLTQDDDTYHLLYNDDFSKLKLDDETLSDVTLIADAINDLENNLILFPPQEEDTSDAFAGSLTEFTAEDMEGNTVTEEVLAGYDVTMVNCWISSSSYCTDEMADLEAVYEQLPANVNMISICFDWDSDEEAVKQVIADNDITFTVLKANDDLNAFVGDALSGYPTTFFTDSEGNVIGEYLDGAPLENVVTTYQELIQTALSQCNTNLSD